MSVAVETCPDRIGRSNWIIRISLSNGRRIGRVPGGTVAGTVPDQRRRPAYPEQTTQPAGCRIGMNVRRLWRR